MATSDAQPGKDYYVFHLINQPVIMHIIQKLSSQSMFTLICLQMM